MIILGINKTTHNGSVALLKDGELLFHLEGERLSNIKHDKFQFQALSKIKDYVDHVDHIVLSGFSPTLVYDKYIHNKKARNKPGLIIFYEYNYLFITYIVTSKPKRSSVAEGAVHMIVSFLRKI